MGVLILPIAAAPGLASDRPPTQQQAAPAAVAEPVSAALETQVLLDRRGFSPGEIDGRPGANTRRAMDAFRRAHGLRAGDAASLTAALKAEGTEILTSYVVTAEDAAGPFVPDIPADVMAQAVLPSLSYTSVLELIAERTHASPALLRTLNPGVEFVAGATLRVPNVAQAAAPVADAASSTATGAHARRVVVSRSRSDLTVYDSRGRVVFSAPVTSGSQYDPLPLGRWTVTAVVRRPTFNYNPALFWDADPAHAKVKLPPGPNGPVGTVWIDLSKPHYGIHGTAEPGQVGHSTSHGCVRLTNWDAETLAGLVNKGTVVQFER